MLSSQSIAVSAPLNYGYGGRRNTDYHFVQLSLQKVTDMQKKKFFPSCFLPGFGGFIQLTVAVLVMGEVASSGFPVVQQRSTGQA